MASIFTFDPDPPRVSSPWASSASARPNPASSGDVQSRARSQEALAEDFDGLLVNSDSDLNVTRLEAEPQDGPTEYKLHLLLRPRRSFCTTSASNYIAGSQQFKSASPSHRGSVDIQLGSTSMAQSTGSRQHRLEQLTTQLLWRLQQSSPHHTSSASNVILPSLPDATPALDAPKQPSKLLPGLEESKGALYEIGVSDDGTFVGLARDEMTESLTNLRAMAASLGCSVDVLRMVPVGECEWLENAKDVKALGSMKRGRLYVAEAYVKPELQSSDDEHHSRDEPGAILSDEPAAHHVSKEQLRVTITGATTSGKSSLLGTLSTSTLDNGRGKSRLSLLKHRHEIVSGMTSSVSQELIGYCDAEDGASTNVINYGTPNVSSWNNIHTASEPGRLVFVSDSAGHPRYRRTTVRGLVGWAPHWTLLCIAANGGIEGELSCTDADGHSFSGASAHLSMAHLDVCLKLALPLVVVITKLDAANKANFRQILSTLLSMLKSAGRKPVILGTENKTWQEHDLHQITRDESADIERLVPELCQNPLGRVPILFTSAVKGNGVLKLHALLRRLPIPSQSEQSRDVEGDEVTNGAPGVLFHIEDTFDLPLAAPSALAELTKSGAAGAVVSGHLAHGTIPIGDELLLGPVSTGLSASSVSGHSHLPPSSHDDSFLTPRSFSDALAEATASPRIRTTPRDLEWRRVKVVSTRNLRLPVRALREDQAGTVGLIPVDTAAGQFALEFRKGMVLTVGEANAAHTFTASFDVSEASSVVVGSLVIAYCASIRQSAKVVAISLQSQDDKEPRGSAPMRTSEDDDGTFAFDWDGDGGENGDGESERSSSTSNDAILVTFQFTAYRAWLESGSKVLIMPGGGQGWQAAQEKGMKGVAGLDGFVGRIVETFG